MLLEFESPAVEENNQRESRREHAQLGCWSNKKPIEPIGTSFEPYVRPVPLSHSHLQKADMRTSFPASPTSELAASYSRNNALWLEWTWNGSIRATARTPAYLYPALVPAFDPDNPKSESHLLRIKALLTAPFIKSLWVCPHAQ